MQKTIEDIKKMSIWMLWKKRARGSKVSKIPIAASGGGYDDKHRRYSFLTDHPPTVITQVQATWDNQLQPPTIL